MKPDILQFVAPADNTRAEIELSGFSGAKILLIQEEAGLAFVRKISASVSGNVRLQAQAVKQRLMAGLLDGCARTPKVLSEGYQTDGTYFFDMEFVRGQDGIAFLRGADLPDVVAVIDRLCDSLRRLGGIEDDAARFSPRTVALEKCAEIRSKTPSGDARALALLDHLDLALHAADMPAFLFETACHGDMTLENIIITENKELVFIDLLDSFFSHWLADVAKLEQDLKAQWYTRRSPPLSVSVTHYVQERLSDLCDSQGLGPVDQLRELLLATHLARILPYAADPQHRDFVLDRLAWLLARHDGRSAL